MATAVGGIGFVVCFAVAATLYAGGAGHQSGAIAAYYSNPSRWRAQIAGFAVLAVGLVFLAGFVAGLRSLAMRTEPWSSLMFGTGMATVVCLGIANALWAASAFTTLLEPGYAIDPRSHLLMEDAGFVFLVTAGVMGAGFVGATSLGAARDRGLPRWLIWLGVPVGLALLAAYWYLPLFAFFAWIVLVSISSLRSVFSRAP